MERAALHVVETWVVDLFVSVGEVGVHVGTRSAIAVAVMA